MNSFPFLSKLFSKTFIIFMLLFMLVGIVFYLRFPHLLYDNLIDNISDFLKNNYNTGGNKSKIDSGMNKLSLLITILSFAIIIYLQFWKWLINQLKNGKQFFSFPAKIQLEKTDWIIITFLTVTAFLLRIFPITQGLWQDEIGQYNTFIEPGLMASIFPKSSMGGHPLMQIIVTLFTQITGVSEFTLRFPVFFIAVLSIPVLYIVCLRISGQKLMATIAALLLTIHTYHIYYSFQMKGYAILVFLCILSNYFLLKFLFYSQSKKTKTLLILVNVLIVYTHLYAIYLVVAQQLVVIVMLLISKYKKSDSTIYISRDNVLAYFQSFIISILIIFLLYLPQLPAIFMNILDTTRGDNSYSIFSYFYDVVVSSNFVIAYSDYILICYLYALLVCLVFIIIVKKNILYQIIFFIAVSLFLITGILPSGSGYTPRYMICEVPLFVIISALVINELWQTSKNFYKLIAIFLFVTYIIITIFSFPKTYQTIQDYRGAVNYVHKNRISTNTIIVSNSLGKTEVTFYDKQIIPLFNIQQFDSLMDLHSEMFAIIAYEEFAGYGLYKDDKEIQIKIEKEFKHIKTLDGEFPVKIWYYNNVKNKN